MKWTPRRSKDQTNDHSEWKGDYIPVLQETWLAASVCTDVKQFRVNTGHLVTQGSCSTALVEMSLGAWPGSPSLASTHPSSQLQSETLSQKANEEEKEKQAFGPGNRRSQQLRMAKT